MRYARRSALAAFLVALFVCTAARTQAQVLEQVPSNALVVLKINKLQDVNTKIGRWVESMGIGAFAPQALDPLASLQEHLGIQKGLDTNGEAALVMMDPDAHGGDPEQALIVLFPVSDYNAFLGNFPKGNAGKAGKAGKAQGKVSTIQPAGAPQQYFVANWGKHAAVSLNQALVANVPAKGGLRLPAATAREAKNKDIILWANIPALREKALPLLKEGRGEIMGEIQRNMGQDPKAKRWVPVVQALVGQAITVAERFMEDAQASTLGVNLGEQGINVTAMAEFEPQSYMGKLSKELPGKSGVKISGLPDRRYFIYGGASINPEVVNKVLNDVANPINEALKGVGPEGQQIAKVIDSMRENFQSMESASFGYVVPEGELGQEAIFQMVMVARGGDAKAIQKSQTELMTAMSTMMRNMLPKNQGAEMTFTVTPGGKTIDGIRFDTYKMDFLVADKAKARQAKMVNSIMFGPEGMTGIMGAVDADTFLAVQGGSEQLIQDAIAAAKGDNANIAQLETTKTVDEQLPKGRVIVEYIAVDQIIKTAMKAADQFGGGAPPFQLPDNLPPVAVAISAEGPALRFDLVLPSELVESVAGASIQLMMQMQGGPAPGGRAPGDPGGL